jgi:hypothetical protein
MARFLITLVKTAGRIYNTLLILALQALLLVALWRTLFLLETTRYFVKFGPVVDSLDASCCRDGRQGNE